MLKGNDAAVWVGKAEENGPEEKTGIGNTVREANKGILNHRGGKRENYNMPLVPTNSATKLMQDG